MAIQGLSILERLIDPARGNYTPEVARYFLTFDFSHEEHARYESLAAKAQEGKLSTEEAAEFDELLAANALLTVLQSKARLSLQHQMPAA